MQPSAVHAAVYDGAVPCKLIHLPDPAGLPVMPHSEFLDAALEAARAAAEVVRRYYKRNLRVAIKADKSPVTEADVETEKTIRDACRLFLPDESADLVAELSWGDLLALFSLVGDYFEEWSKKKLEAAKRAARVAAGEPAEKTPPATKSAS